MNEELQQKYIELQYLDQQIKQIQQQINLLSQHSSELKKLEENLRDLESVESKKDIFVSLGSGIFLKAQLQDNKNVLMNIGANTLTMMDMDASKKIITDQIKEIEETMKQIETELEPIVFRNMLLQQEIQELSKGEQ